MLPEGVAKTLGLAIWPFNVVPDPNATLVWADRAELQRQLRRLYRRLLGHQSSSFHLLWADFGAGKTHALLYLQQLALTEATGRLFPVYTALPKASRSFVDIYRSVIKGIGLERLAATCSSLRRNPDLQQKAHTVLSEAAPSLPIIFEALRIGSNQIKDIAQRWILADQSLTRQDLNAASLPPKIRNTDEAISTLSGVIRLILLDGHPRVLIMIDEFQRTGVLRRSVLDEINAGIHTFFNDCPQGISLLLSFSFGSAANIRHYLNPELQSRADPQVLTIPSLSTEDAVTFLNDLVRGAATHDGESRIDYNIFSMIVEWLASVGPITPRKLMQITGSVLSEAAIDCEDGLIETVDPACVRRILNTINPSAGNGE